MQKIVKHLLFKSALAIVALHALIPHPHSNQLSAEKHLEIHSKANSLIGFLRLTFHESDDNSLDNLVYSNDNLRKTTPYQPIFESIFENNFIGIKNEFNEPDTFIYSYTLQFYKLFFASINGLRGPPSVS